MDSSIIPKFEFDLTGKSEKPKLPERTQMVPWITTATAWKQFTNDYVYKADSLMRDWLRIMNKDTKWSSNYKLRRYTFSQMFEILMGEPYDYKEHSPWVIPLSRIMAYYSTKIQDGYWDSKKGKMKSKTYYTISGARVKKPAYSLRLRLEEFSEQGVIPDVYNMKLPKDDLKKGQARRTETRRTTEKRREEWKKRQKN